MESKSTVDDDERRRLWPRLKGVSDLSAFRVLMVCTANYCRSPIAEQLLSAAARDRFGAANTWLVESAGTDASWTRPIHEFSAKVLTERGVLVEGHESRMLDEAMLRDADLILTAAREHRSKVVRILPAAIGRTFTVLQFARLADAVDTISATDSAELGRQLLTEVASVRALLQPVPPGFDDLQDPMGGPIEEFEACATSLNAVVNSIMRPLQLGAPTYRGRHRRE